jgi:hypothetical protein
MTYSGVQLERIVCREQAKDLGWIYVAASDATSLVKIGFATDLRTRLSSLNTASPFQLNYEWTFRGLKEDERAIQRMLKAHQYNREWFRMCDEIEEFLWDLWDLRFDLACRIFGDDYVPSDAAKFLKDIEHLPIGPVLHPANFGLEAPHE